MKRMINNKQEQKKNGRRGENSGPQWEVRPGEGKEKSLTDGRTIGSGASKENERKTPNSIKILTSGKKKR